ncbi:O-methyltransferase [Pantoea agglomerans]|jgi:predicted O-methyltransferase YrrM|uniref:O-methyltransferase n=1 Tax=Enterobacter agglomerans TaxID=549 RepID=UPI00026D27CF|nr:O-methyltransferase [Pantoea agglomerans]MBD8119551.1 O-methyltransferase [Pantoea agglomerans]MCH9406082.1 O-methyltransferase [Pantoea agglomerans]QTC52775.1 O-methyltransferase [Pantoea agglomerans]WNK32818.1 O-methyltransferase [Pantoea agglomerans]WNK64589.1 O-methyltransferase [Pantoea agglomerans]
MRIPDYPSQDSDKWAQVDAWFSEKLAPEDSDLKYALANNSDQGLPTHDVSSLQGKMLAIFMQMSRAVRVLEIGTLGGYSTIWMAKALPPHGSITTIEFNEHHAEVASQNLNKAGLAERVTLHRGAALGVLPTLDAPFDLIFIDADKVNNPHYLEWAIRLSKPGTVIVGDNTVRGGNVIDSSSEDPNVIGLRKFVEMISEDERLEATAVQTVGEKGWDGFVIAIVKTL